MTRLADTIDPPYYAVIFSSLTGRSDHDAMQGYAETAERMLELAAQQKVFLGVESAREEIGITVSYWQDLAAIANWKAQVEHQKAQAKGRQQWYSAYTVRIARVERSYGFFRPR